MKMIPGVPGVWRQYDEQLILWTPFWADGPSGGTSENCVGVTIFIFYSTSKILPFYGPWKVTLFLSTFYYFRLTGHFCNGRFGREVVGQPL